MTKLKSLETIKIHILQLYLNTSDLFDHPYNLLMHLTHAFVCEVSGINDYL